MHYVLSVCPGGSSSQVCLLDTPLFFLYAAEQMALHSTAKTPVHLFQLLRPTARVDHQLSVCVRAL